MYSNTYGISHLIKIINSHSIPLIFILTENINPNNENINFIKYSLKKKSLEYQSINNLKIFTSYYNIYNKLVNNKFIVLTYSLNNNLFHTYFKNISENLLIINFFDNNSTFKNLDYKICNCINCSDMIIKLRNKLISDYNNIINIPIELTYN